MHYHRLAVISTVAGVIGGLFFTLLSGLYVVKPLVIDAEVIYFGFPLAWFGAGRKGLLVVGPWHYGFIWHGFIIDFIVYGLLTVAAVYLYFRTIAAGNKKAR